MLEKITMFGVGQPTQDIYNSDMLSEMLDKMVITCIFPKVVGKEIRRIHLVFFMSVHETENLQMRYDRLFLLFSEDNLWMQMGNLGMFLL